MAIDPKDAQRILDKYKSVRAPFDCSQRLIDDPPLLAHYTSVEVAERIIKNQEIWFCHPFYMNDVEELQWGMLKGIQQFPIYAQTAGGNQQRARLLQEGFNSCVGRMNEQTLVNTYILCLSEHKPTDTDGVLSMWRSYANLGYGAALVFNMRNLTHRSQVPLEMGKIIYGTEEARLSLLRQGLTEWANITAAENLPDPHLDLASLGAFYFIKAFALLTKHIGFKEEQEWRFVYVPELDPREKLVSQFSYHITARGAEPILKFKIDPVCWGGPADSLSLRQLTQFILLGPSLQSPLAKAAFQRMLIGTCLEGCKVFASTIPLRPSFR